MTTLVREPTADWDFRGCNTQYGTHGIHTYVAAMIPQLARRLVDEHIPAGGVVLDPFCGGGAVLVEAVASGRGAVGRDVNPLAILISQAKTTQVNREDAGTALESIIAAVKPAAAPPLVERGLAFWFKPEHLGALYELKRAIDRAALQEPVATLFKAVFSATVRDVSLTYRNEVRLRRMAADEIERFAVDAVARFQERASRAIEAASALPHAEVDIQTGMAQSIALADDECDGIVCSPPYGDERNGVSYIQFAKNMLAWLGHSTATVKESKAQTLGWGNSERTLPYAPALAASIEAIADHPEAVRAATAFYADYFVSLREMARVARGPIVIVIGQRVLKDTVFDNGAITTELMEDIGLKRTYVGYRQLPTKRLPRMRTYGAAIDREAILVFRK